MSHRRLERALPSSAYLGFGLGHRIVALAGQNGVVRVCTLLRNPDIDVRRLDRAKPYPLA
jgi:hypothetical protein